jgi:hypothetical protein
MNDLDLNILKSFARYTIKYLAEEDCYSLDGMWQNLDEMRKLRKKINPLIPLVTTIIELSDDIPLD